ncbi:MAG: phosphoglycerate mutase family protein [Actinomycetota bacterium]
MPLHLVRHASAGDRSRWGGDDLERPLDERGRDQADAIDRFFADHDVRGVWSSLATRCAQTIAPTAARHGFSVELRRELTEGARPNDLLELLREEALVDGDLVLCSHGDLIPEVLNRLLREGMSVIGGRGCEKGSIWTLDVRGRDIVSGTYTAVP